MFTGGKRQREYSTSTDPLPLSGKLIPEFVGRRNIRDMFARKPSLPQSHSTNATSSSTEDAITKTAPEASPSATQTLHKGIPVSTSISPSMAPLPALSPSVSIKKRSKPEATTSKPVKRTKPSSAPAPSAAAKGQQSLKGFFKPKTLSSTASTDGSVEEEIPVRPSTNGTASQAYPDSVAELVEAHLAASQNSHSDSPATHTATLQSDLPVRYQGVTPLSTNISPSADCTRAMSNSNNVHDPIESKESWSKLFTRPAAPRCEGHDEPCITLLTKKPGMNLGRSFWMCPRPLGPSGAKERNTQWRCQTFIWCSDWNSSSAGAG